MAVVDDKGREKERYPVVYGARILVEDGAPVKSNQILLEWDPYTFSILTEVSGVVHFKDLIDGLTLQEQVDEVTGMSQLVVTDSPDEKRQPHGGGAAGRRGGLALGSQEVPHADARPPDGARRRRSARRRRAGQDPARNHQDQGHHRRSAARGGAVRSAQAARDGHHRGDQRRGEVRRSLQGPAQDLRGGRRRRAARVRAAARRPHQRAGRRARESRRAAHGRPAQSARHPGRARRKGTAEVPGQRDSGSLPPAGRQHQRQAPGSHLPPDDALGEGGRYRRHRIPAGRSGRQVQVPRRKRSR